MSEVDISALRMKEAPPPRKPLGPRIALGALIVITLGVAASFLVPLLTPARPVVTASIRDAGGASGSSVTTAEAAGWIEPDPYAIVVRPLVSGVLEELNLLEGHAVKKGETIVGRLRSAELEAARDRAKAKLALEQENLKHRIAELEVAKGLLEQKAELRLDEVRASNTLAATTERLEALRADYAAVQAERDARSADYDGQKKLAEAGGTYPIALAKAKAELEAAEAHVRQRKHQVGALEAEQEEARATLVIAREVLKDPRDLAGDVTTATANVAHRTSMRDTAKVEYEIAERELGWATVRAPADGLVMTLLAAPGEVVGPGAKALVSIYDPKKLQARIDVPLASMAGVHEGQKVEIRSEVTGSKKTMGKVLRIQRESDMLKNTLQVKVELVDPDPLLRPETLCRARFLASGEKKASGPALFRVPRTAVRGGAVYVLDPATGLARRVAVEQVGETEGDLVVKGALSVTQKVILDDVEDGERVEEQS